MGEDLIVRNVTVIDGLGAPARAAMEVSVKDGRFCAIRPAGTRDARVVYDAHGGFLIPGLWEGHTHLRAYHGEPAQDETARIEAMLAGYLQAGITTVLELGGPLEFNRSFREHRGNPPPATTADFLFAGPTFCGCDGWPVTLHHDHTLVREPSDAESARQMLLQFENDVDFVKCHYHGEHGVSDKLPRTALQAVVATAHERGKNVLVHIRTKADIEDVVDAGADCVEHAFLPTNPHDDSEAADAAKLLAANGTYFCPTLTVFEQIARSGDRRYLEELARDGIIAERDIASYVAKPSFSAPFPHHGAAETLARLRYAMRTLPMYRDAGVKISAGSDVALFMSRPAALLRELQLLSAAGLSPGDVIVAATRHSAAKIGREAESGSIVAGAIADAVVLDADPLADVQNVVRSEHRVGTIRRGMLALNT